MKTKRILSFLLSAILILSLLPMTASAAALSGYTSYFIGQELYPVSSGGSVTSISISMNGSDTLYFAFRGISKAIWADINKSTATKSGNVLELTAKISSGEQQMTATCTIASNNKVVAMKVDNTWAFNGTYCVGHKDESTVDGICDYCGTALHNHEFTYAANNGKLTATCIDGCNKNYDTNPLTLTLTAPSSLFYDGNAKGFTFADGEAAAWKEAVGSDAPTITYYQKQSGQDNYELKLGTPIDAGNYMAKIAKEGKEAQVKFTIDKATPYINNVPAPNDIDYGQALKDSTLSGGYAQISSTNTAEVGGLFTWTNGDTKPAVSDSETTEYDVTFTPSSDYEANFTNVTCKVKVKVNPINYADSYSAAENAVASGILKAKSGNTVEITLPAIPEGASYGTVTNTNSALYTVDETNKANGKLTVTAVKDFDQTTESSATTFTVSVTPDNNHNGYNIVVTVTPNFHEHQLSYSADGAVLTATCTNEGCDLTGALTLTLTEDGFTNETETKAWTDAGLNLPEVHYFSGEDDLGTVKPETPGSFVAKATVGSDANIKTAEVMFAYHGVYVNGVKVTDLNKDDILNDGTVSFNPETKTLTLNGANVESTIDNAIYAEINDITINVVGENNLETEIDGYPVIYADGCNLTITGDGDLNVWNNCEGCGIYGTNDVSITGTVSVDIRTDGESATNSKGISAGGNITLGTRGNISVLSMGSFAIFAENGCFTVNNGAGKMFFIGNYDEYGAIFAKTTSVPSNYVMLGSADIVVDTTELKTTAKFDGTEDCSAVLADGNDTIAKTIYMYKKKSSGGGTSSYTVKFDTNGGNALKNISVRVGQTIGTIETPKKEGFVFDGWYSDKELTKPFNADDKITKSTTLYAKWKVDPARQIILTIGKKEAIVFTEEKANDVAPKIVNDRTMLPIRFVAEALGATVDWNEGKQLVTISAENLKIEIIISESVAFVNGEEIKLDSPAFIENDRTYLPLRFVAENLGAEVEWIEESQQVVITKALPEKTTTK